jgi:hypothetical protein
MGYQGRRKAPSTLLRPLRDNPKYLPLKGYGRRGKQPEVEASNQRPRQAARGRGRALAATARDLAC